jgi:hypothetical protein
MYLAFALGRTGAWARPTGGNSPAGARCRPVSRYAALKSGYSTTGSFRRPTRRPGRPRVDEAKRNPERSEGILLDAKCRPEGSNPPNSKGGNVARPEHSEDFPRPTGRAQQELPDSYITIKTRTTLAADLPASGSALMGKTNLSKKEQSNIYSASVTSWIEKTELLTISKENRNGA